MAGVAFIVTIPTEQEEREIELKEEQSKFGHSSKKETDRLDYGSFKIVRVFIHCYLVFNGIRSSSM